MSNILFAKEDIRKLEKNKNVLRVSEYLTIYNSEFRIISVNEYLAGKQPRQIFEENGFDINIIEAKRVDSSSDRWRVAYKKDGILGLEDTGKTANGRPRYTELTKEELIGRQEARMKLIKGQVEMLKKLDAKKGRWYKK